MSWPQQPSQERGGPSLAAELEVFSAADAMQWAGMSGFTGRLAFRANSVRINVLLDQGAIVNASTNGVSESLGRHLFSMGLVDEVDLAAAIVYSRDNHARVGAAMTALGVLDAMVLDSALRGHTINLACRPLTWTSGRLSAERVALDDYPRLTSDPVDVTFLMMEAALREDEVRRIRRLLPSDDLEIAALSADIPTELSARSRRFLECLKVGDTLDTVHQRIGGDRHGALVAAGDLLGSGILVVSQSGAESPSAG